jgi:hypothetical protein
VTEYPWYEESPPDAPLMQGDLIESCPVLVFAQVPELENIHNSEALVDADTAHGFQMVRAIVMTQSCDLLRGHVRNVILCPTYHIEEYKRLWEEYQRGRGQNPSLSSWGKHTKEIKDGKIWNLTMLQERNAPRGGMLSIPHQVVDFHEIFSLPLDFLARWVRASGANRLSLAPPYREHLSQAFARFFMRVGLPEDIGL